MALKITMLISAPISRVAKAISRHHQETVSDVIICKDKYDADEALPHDFSLEKCGITGPEATLLYDYVPFTYPLIGWFGLSSLSISYTYLKLNYLFDGPYQRVGKSSSFRTTPFSFLFFFSFPRLSLSCSCFWGLVVKIDVACCQRDERIHFLL